MARHSEDVARAPALVLESAVALGQGDKAVTDGAGDRDGNPEARFVRGFGDVDQDAVFDRVTATTVTPLAPILSRHCIIGRSTEAMKQGLDESRI